jgi:hypothetical protein
MRAYPFGVLALLLQAPPLAVAAERAGALSSQPGDAGAQRTVRQESGPQSIQDAARGPSGDGMSPAAPAPDSPHQAVEERDCN